MRRREFISGAVMLGWPAASYAQTASHVIGFVNSASAEGYSSMADAFKEGLAAAGYREGANVRIEYRWADNRYDRIPGLVTDVVARQVDVIVANGPVIAAVKAATSTIPIVFTSGEDPVRLGLVERLNRPGGNVTGAIVLSAEVGSKRLQLLHELLPQAKTIAVKARHARVARSGERGHRQNAGRAPGRAPPLSPPRRCGADAGAGPPLRRAPRLFWRSGAVAWRRSSRHEVRRLSRTIRPVAHHDSARMCAGRTARTGRRRR